jgi:2-alkyl-3-oxoalkanoate reductase
MKLLVTGAGGFVGRAVVATAVARGHAVRALLRPGTSTVPEEWQAEDAVEVVRGDLRDASCIHGLLAGVDAVVHLAAAKSGDLYDQLTSTVLATENLLNAMAAVGRDNLVLTSSFSVYEYQQRPEWSMIDEAAPAAVDRWQRDEYCITKLEQERIVLEQAERLDWRCAVLRLGAVFGRDNLWTARAGIPVNDRLWIRTGSRAPIPLTYVENCAEAIVLAAEYQGAERRVLVNVVDDDIPTQKDYVHALRAATAPMARIVGVPWTVMKLLAATAAGMNRLLFKGNGKIPGLFVPARLHARCRPMRYTNAQAKALLGWAPRYGWREAIERVRSGADVGQLNAADRGEATTAMEDMRVGPIP